MKTPKLLQFRPFGGDTSAPPPPPLPYGRTTERLGPDSLAMSGAYDSLLAGDARGVQSILARMPTAQTKPGPILKSLYDGLRQSAYNYRLEKALDAQLIQSKERQVQAAVQGSVVNAAMDAWGVYDRGGVKEPTTMSFDFLRYFCGACEPIAAIIGKRVNQVSLYSRRAEVRRGRATEPGFKIAMTKKRDRPNEADQAVIDFLEQFIEECGVCPPPVENRRLGWQPGFASFLAELTRDRLTLDHVAVRRWTDGAGLFPIAAFACEDAARILTYSREFEGLGEDGVRIEVPREHDRATTKEITLVKVDDGGNKIEEFLPGEVFTVHQRSRTDVRVNGYGYSEAEEAYDFGTMFIAARDFNGLRFSKDALPRGILALASSMTDQQFSAFQLYLKQTTQGVNKKWNIPIVRNTNAEKGPIVQWIPFDMSPKDMEHSQTFYMSALVPHVLYQISPDETGFSSASPFRPPLSEASPEVNLKYSQDTGLRPLLRWIEDILNREIVWKMYPSRRYSFRFMGVGDYDELQDVQVRTARLQAGLSTPEEEWAELDWTPPAEIAAHPAARFPAPFTVGFQMMQQMHDQAQAAQQQQQQTDQQTQQQQQQGDIAKFQAGKQGYAADQEQGEPGGPGAPGGDAPQQLSQPTGAPGGTDQPGQPVLKAIGWPFAG